MYKYMHTETSSHDHTIVLYCIFVLFEKSIADRTQQMEQAN